MFVKSIAMCLFFLLCGTSVAANPASRELLTERFLKAQASSDFPAIAELINWEGVSPYKRRIIRGYTRSTFGRTVLSAELEALGNDYFSAFKVGRREYVSNHEVTHLLRIKMQNPVTTAQGEQDTVVFLVGPHEDGYRISITVPASGSRPPDND